ncbi:hypothetical protein BO99DRAFT_47955 [Aspergillus violaceofuscus CBS 115571]|uniref:Uncharacterized protein n=1 Tax=Aspergillus violaceofuscus (strain CBS 115571) TaxID=1450538 RepID=A0A2V5GZ73_ASPV1|nr:hypothetical protein BO99DRAFT_47955 [Aspergillus violaceofuscus CBS 115571]
MLVKEVDDRTKRGNGSDREAEKQTEGQPGEWIDKVVGVGREKPERDKESGGGRGIEGMPPSIIHFHLPQERSSTQFKVGGFSGIQTESTSSNWSARLLPPRDVKLQSRCWE